MTTYEMIKEIENTTTLELNTARDTYLEAEAKLVALVGLAAIGLKVNHQTYGTGKITYYRSDCTLDCLVVTVAFDTVIKQFSLAHILSRIENNTELNNLWAVAFETHTKLFNQCTELENQARQLEREAAKQAEEEAKAEAKYQAAKAKALQDFETLTKAGTTTRATNELYYSLGWLSKNIGTISAALPDYLLSGFERHFGSDVKPTVVDSRKKTVSGYSMQWALSMKASILKKAKESIPGCLAKYLNSAGNALTNTAFVWDLVDTFGFNFGKEQDIEKIKAAVPTDYLSSFEAGLIAAN